jgi:hypothetical protein
MANFRGFVQIESTKLAANKIPPSGEQLTGERENRKNGVLYGAI